MNEKLISLIKPHTTCEGVTETGLDGFQIFRITQPVTRTPAVYFPSICIILQGSKNAYLGGKKFTYDPKNYLCCGLPVPVEAEILVATPEEPVFGMIINLESKVITELLFELETLVKLKPQKSHFSKDQGIIIVPRDQQFNASILGLVNLLSDPVGLQLLGQGKLREIIYMTLKSKAGPFLRQKIAISKNLFNILDFIQRNLSKPIFIEDLVKQSGMSKAVLHRKFKAATTLSPLQYIKALRLNEAAMLIARGTNVSQAAHEVGYESSSQFCREFRRHYGNSPRKWANSLAQKLDSKD